MLINIVSYVFCVALLAIYASILVSTIGLICVKFPFFSALISPIITFATVCGHYIVNYWCGFGVNHYIFANFIGLFLIMIAIMGIFGHIEFNYNDDIDHDLTQH